MITIQLSKHVPFSLSVIEKTDNTQTTCSCNIKTNKKQNINKHLNNNKLEIVEH